MLGALHALSPSIVIPTPGGCYQLSSFIDGETEAACHMAINVGAGV